jgi:hypothetical protein
MEEFTSPVVRFTADADVSPLAPFGRMGRGETRLYVITPTTWLQMETDWCDHHQMMEFRLSVGIDREPPSPPQGVPDVLLF